MTIYLYSWVNSCIVFFCYFINDHLDNNPEKGFFSFFLNEFESSVCKESSNSESDNTSTASTRDTTVLPNSKLNGKLPCRQLQNINVPITRIRIHCRRVISLLMIFKIPSNGPVTYPAWFCIRGLMWVGGGRSRLADKTFDTTIGRQYFAVITECLVSQLSEVP